MAYHHLERDLGVRREEIPRRLEEFDSGLTNLFGVCAGLIETYAIKNLYRRLDETFEAVENKNFQDRVQDAERIFKARIQRPKDG